MNNWFTADTHFDHDNILEFQPRPFSSIEEMNEAIIENWNSRVKRGDMIYFLGDMSWRNPDIYIPRLNGQIHFIKGNHDKMTDGALLKHKNIHSVNSIKDIRISGVHITLCHYSMRTWNKSCHGSWHLFGHSHGNIQGIGKSFDVGVDCHNYFPISFDEVDHIMAFQPDNKDKGEIR